MDMLPALLIMLGTDLSALAVLAKRPAHFSLSVTAAFQISFKILTSSQFSAVQGRVKATHSDHVLFIHCIRSGCAETQKDSSPYSSVLLIGIHRY